MEGVNSLHAWKESVNSRSSRSEKKYTNPGITPFIILSTLTKKQFESFIIRE